MAYTFSDATALKLAKVKLGGKEYNLKDDAAREIIAKLNKDIVENTIGEITAGGTNLVNSGTLNTHLGILEQGIKKNENAIEELGSIVAGGLVLEVVDKLPTASDKQAGKIYLVPHTHGTQDIYDEYIVVRSGTAAPYTYTWEKIGNTDIDLSSYVSDVSYASGVLSQTKGGKKATVHTFGKFADADKGTVNTSAFLTAVAGKVTPSVSLKEGTIMSHEGMLGIPQSILPITTIDDVGTLPSKAKDSFTANKPTVIDTTKFNGGTAASISAGFFSAGTLPTKAADQFTANTPAQVDVTEFHAGGKAADTFTKASIATKPTSQFATGGMIGSVDGETLVFENASKAAAVTDVTINGGSFTEGKFTAPSLGAGFFTPGTAASFTEGAFSAGTAPSIDTTKFHGGAPASLGTGFYTAGSAASFTEGAFSAGTLPTTKATSPSFGQSDIKYFGVEGAESTVTITPTHGTTSVDVTPVAKA